MLASLFEIVFALFVGAMVLLCGLIMAWAIRRDRSSWREWKQRRTP